MNNSINTDRPDFETAKEYLKVHRFNLDHVNVQLAERIMDSFAEQKCKPLLSTVKRLQEENDTRQNVIIEFKKHLTELQEEKKELVEALGIEKNIVHVKNTQNELLTKSYENKIELLIEALKHFMNANPNDGTWNYQSAWDNARRLINKEEQLEQ